MTRRTAIDMRNDRSSHPVLSHTDGLATSTSDILLLIGRILLGWIFVRSGYGKLFNIAAYSGTFPVRGLYPWLAYIAVPVEFFGGLALMLGLATRYVVLVMVIFMLVATFSSHRYWEFADLNARRAQDTNFYKNLAMLGGFFFFFACGAGRFSIDGWLRRR
jgi:putative oxidoreductase